MMTKSTWNDCIKEWYECIEPYEIKDIAIFGIMSLIVITISILIDIIILPFELFYIFMKRDTR